ncbi:fimbrillin family protein [Segatella paludivivens]|uniref:fimbrillin family protein n=1 Tax=Segatella paludivivens TaxID=185294 RepID=UPI00035D18F0|nr:fimbrillin family protein [Segatella paludivivens]
MVKKFLRGINISLLLLIIISTFYSCANEINVFEENNNKQINFFVSVPQWKNTDSLATTNTSRATPITDNSFGTDKSFNLIADQNDGAGNYSTLIDKESVSFTNNIWQTTPYHYYWSGIANKTISFYAYYPSTISNVSHTAGSSPILSYTVPDNVSDQIDIMTATNNNVNGNTNSSTPLTFNHIFAAIQFNIGSSGMPNGTITGISLNNILYKGTYNFNGTWTQDSTTKKSFSQTVSSSTTAGTTITSGATTFMMMPQTLGSDASITVTYSNGGTLTKSISSTWTAGNIYIYNVSKTIPLAAFDYTGYVQTYTTPLDGIYKIECWGASGGTASSSLAGRGGYVSGNLKLEKNKIIYVYVGGYGNTITSTGHTDTTPGGYNGGGTCVNSAAGGGGATDIRLIGGNWNDFSSLKSRIMVAGGGGGENNYSDTYGPQTTRGGCGGGLQGGSTISRVNNITMPGGTQTSGGITNQYTSQTKGENGKFGIGGNSSSNYGGGGGGGYYGGAGGCNVPKESSNASLSGGEMPGSGGSSFISGYTGCNAILESSTSDKILSANSPNHYSGYIFINMQMLAGTASMMSPTGSVETGHGGNGYARITFVSAN